MGTDQSTSGGEALAWRCLAICPRASSWPPSWGRKVADPGASKGLLSHSPGANARHLAALRHHPPELGLNIHPGLLHIYGDL
jgi:hypothetical protein